MRLKDLLNRDTQDLLVIAVTDEASPLGQYNGGHNPVADFDVDVTKGATGDLGSFLGSPHLSWMGEAFRAYGPI